MGEPLLPPRGFLDRLARVTPLRAAAGVVASAAVLAALVVAGVEALGPASPPGGPAAAVAQGPPAAAPAPADPAVPRAGDAFSALPPPEMVPAPEPGPAAAPPERAPPSRAEAPAPVDPDTTSSAGRTAALAPPSPDPSDAVPGTWTSVPQPGLRDKAEGFLAKGEVASARLWLAAAADRGDAEAFFRLAETYDPAVLGEWGVVGMTSEPARARELYARALAGGVEGARSRIERLDAADPAMGDGPG